MKKIISKIRNKRLKGNVSLLVIFILLACSVIALLSINQIQRLLTYWNMTFNYFRAFYIAKAGTELWLTEVYYREAGFEQSIGTWDAIVSWLALGYSGFNPYFTMNISWTFQYLTDDVRYTNECTENNKITLGTGEWIMLSLFTDETDWINNILSPSENDDKIQPLTPEQIRKIDFWNNVWSFTFWIFAYEWWDMIDVIVLNWGNLDTFRDKVEVSNFLRDYQYNRRKYLTIKNSGNEPVSFCISWEWYIPYSDSLITVRWYYGDMEVWLQSVVKKEVPSWSLDVLWW